MYFCGLLFRVGGGVPEIPKQSATRSQVARLSLFSSAGQGHTPNCRYRCCHRRRRPLSRSRALPYPGRMGPPSSGGGDPCCGTTAPNSNKFGTRYHSQ